MSRAISAVALMVLVAGLGLGSGLPANSQQQASPVRLFDNFFTSLVAARQCDAASDAQIDSFMRNALHVQNLALAALAEANPKLEQDDLRQMLNKRARSLGSVTVDLITRRGCDDQKVEKLVELFAAHAQMDLGAPQRGGGGG